MKKMIKHTKKRGQAMVEYIIIVVVVAIAAIAIVATFSESVQGLFSGASEAIGGDAGSVQKPNLSDYNNAN